jgi:hypothetical protein
MINIAIYFYNIDFHYKSELYTPHLSKSLDSKSDGFLLLSSSVLYLVSLFCFETVLDEYM